MRAHKSWQGQAQRRVPGSRVASCNSSVEDTHRAAEQCSPSLSFMGMCDVFLGASLTVQVAVGLPGS